MPMLIKRLSPILLLLFALPAQAQLRGHGGPVRALAIAAGWNAGGYLDDHRDAAAERGLQDRCGVDRRQNLTILNRTPTGIGI